MRVQSIIAVLTAFTSKILSSAIPAQSELTAVDTATKGCDPSEPVKWEQTCPIKGTSVPAVAAIDAIEEACVAAQECHKHYRSNSPDSYNLPEDPWFKTPMVGNGEGFRAFIRLDTKCGMMSPFDWNITSCMDRFRELDHACGGAMDPNNWYFGVAQSQCDKTTVYFEPHTLPPPTPRDVQEEADTDTNQIVSSLFPRGVSTLPARDEKKYVALAPQCSWTPACDLSDNRFIEIEGARAAINNACRVAQNCSNQTFAHSVIGQGPHGEEATLNLGSSCGFLRKSQLTFDVCQSKFWDINRNCGGLRDGRKFYLGSSTSACDGTTIKVERRHYGCDQSSKASEEDCC